MYFFGLVDSGLHILPVYLVRLLHSSSLSPPSPLPLSLSCGLQVMIDVELLGFVYHWGLELNAINVIGEYAYVKAI